MTMEKKYGGESLSPIVLRKAGIARFMELTRSWPLIAIVFVLSGCTTFTKSTPPDYYQLDYEFQSSNCANPFSGAVRVWSLSASAPFDREQMIVLAPTQNVRFSSRHNWVSSPGSMVADKLMRDLARGKVFEDAVPVGNPMSAAYEMSGQIYRFALEENGSPPHAVVELEISLWQEKPKRLLLFRKHFHYQSPPLPDSNPLEFAKAMAGLISQLSIDLRNDICAITPGSSRPAGD